MQFSFFIVVEILFTVMSCLTSPGCRGLFPCLPWWGCLWFSVYTALAHGLHFSVKGLVGCVLRSMSVARRNDSFFSVWVAGTTPQIATAPSSYNTRNPCGSIPFWKHKLDEPREPIHITVSRRSPSCQWCSITVDPLLPPLSRFPYYIHLSVYMGYRHWGHKASDKVGLSFDLSVCHLIMSTGNTELEKLQHQTHLSI